MSLPLAKPVKRPRPRKRIARASRPAKVRKTTVAALKRKLWKLFADYVKERDGNVCYTCDRPVSGVDSQGGHLISRKIGSTFYDPENVHVQCGRCNCGLRGNVPEYTLRFLDQYGEAKYRALLERGRMIHHWSAPELRELIDAIKRSGADFELLYAEKYGT